LIDYLLDLIPHLNWEKEKLAHQYRYSRGLRIKSNSAHINYKISFLKKLLDISLFYD